MGTFIKCKMCGEKIEIMRNKNNKKVPINIEPSVIIDKVTRKYKQVRLNHFVTCCRRQEEIKAWNNLLKDDEE